MTKDSDSVLLLEQLGPPPQILWLMIGNMLERHCRIAFLPCRACSSEASPWLRFQNRRAQVGDTLKKLTEALPERSILKWATRSPAPR